MRLAAVAVPLAVAGLPALAAPPAGQAQAADAASRPPARVAFVLAPDTVRVGEPFTLGVTVRTERGWRAGLPAVLPLGDGYEQRAAAEVREQGGGVWRAYYRLVAWETSPGRLPPVEVELARDGEVLATAFRPPAVAVLSVLPEDEANLELRPARPFLERSGPPWPWILLGILALLALAIARFLRGRAADVVAEEAVTENPDERALHELRELRERWEAGELRGAEFYDRLETTLRRYAEATRGWPPGTLIGALPNGNRDLAGVLHRSAITRFGRVEARPAAPPEALDVCEAWLLEDAG